MESKKKQRIIWILWSLSIVLPLLLIVFRDENDRNGRPVISHNIAQSEHIPGNAVGSKDAADLAEPDKIEEPMSGTSEFADAAGEVDTDGDAAGEMNAAEGITGEMNATDDGKENVSVADNGKEDVSVADDGKEEMNAADNGEGDVNEVAKSDENTEISTEPESGEDSEGTAGEMLPPVDDGEESETTKKERVIDPDKPMVALTFDDGPYRNNTGAIMELFEQYNSRATFFVVGYHLDVYGEATLDAYQRGFQIGNHTMNHPMLPSLSDAEAMEEIRRLNDKLNEMGIEGEAMVRTPYGLPTDYLRENLTVPMIGWNVDSEDWKVGTVDWICEQIIGKVKDGDIVLLHDLHDVTAEAMQLVVPALVEQGFQLVTVEELFRAKGVEPQAGEYYCYVR